MATFVPPLSYMVECRDHWGVLIDTERAYEITDAVKKACKLLGKSTINLCKIYTLTPQKNGGVSKKTFAILDYKDTKWYTWNHNVGDAGYWIQYGDKLRTHQRVSAKTGELLRANKDKEYFEF